MTFLTDQTKDYHTLNGLRRPIQICTLRLCPSDTLCNLQERSISNTYPVEQQDRN